jgi:hypothetical protein
MRQGEALVVAALVVAFTGCGDESNDKFGVI